MFYIDSFNRDEDMSFDEAVRIVKSKHHNDNLLEGMENLKELLKRLQDEFDARDEIHDFYDNWHYEINAFNKVFNDMSKLFV